MHPWWGVKQLAGRALQTGRRCIFINFRVQLKNSSVAFPGAALGLYHPPVMCSGDTCAVTALGRSGFEKNAAEAAISFYRWGNNLNTRILRWVRQRPESGTEDPHLWNPKLCPYLASYGLFWWCKYCYLVFSQRRLIKFKFFSSHVMHWNKKLISKHQ